MEQTELKWISCGNLTSLNDYSILQCGHICEDDRLNIQHGFVAVECELHGHWSKEGHNTGKA